MKISLTPCKYQYSSNFASLKRNDKTTASTTTTPSLLSPAEKEINDIQVKKFKTALKVALTIVLSLDVLYFATKHRLKINKAKVMAENKATNLERIKNLVEPIVLQPPSFDELPIG